MIKGEYVEAIGPKGQFKKHRQLRRIAEYEKQEVSRQLHRGEGAARCSRRIIFVLPTYRDLTNKEEYTYHLCVTSQIQMSPQKHIL